MMLNKYNRTEHLVYNCKYHVIFCPKYRRKIFVDGLDTKLKNIFYDIAEAHKFVIESIEVMPDHIHMIISCNPRFGIMNCVRALKRQSVKRVLEAAPGLVHVLPCIWTRSAFIASVGSVSLDIVKEYINTQKRRNEKD